MSYKVRKVTTAPPTGDAKNPASSFQTFEDLNVYRAAREFRKAILEKLKAAGQSVLALLNGYLHYLRNRSSSVAEVLSGDESLFGGSPM